MTRFFLNRVDHFIIMSKSVQGDLLALFPDAHFDLIPHPLFELFGQPLPKKDARKSLGLKEKRIILYFGFIRPYKGVDILIQATKILKDKLDDFRVLVIGECYENASDYQKLVMDASVEDVLNMNMDFVPNQKVAQYFSAADLVVLPYKSATQSGVVPIAFHFNKPVVVTNVGGLPEIVPNGKAGYVVEGTAEKISEAVIRFFNENKTAAFSHYIQSYKQRFSWDSFTEKLEMLVQ
ncbi:MAG: glycosyltransferase [Fidelibacterota bacterium]